MKKIILSVLLSTYFLSIAVAQGVNVITSQPPGKMYCVGSLPKSDNNSAQKLKIEIFGGNWHSSNVGTKRYSISTRDGLIINEEGYGGLTGNYALRIYQTAIGYDFVIEIKSMYTSIWIQSWLLDAILNQIKVMQPVNITEYNPAGKTDVTSEHTINTFYTTSQSGDIGIGTNSPRNKLDVNGTIRAKEVKIEATNWPDYVFNKEYNLPTLKEVEEHIDEYNHLPNIPSEAEVKENGVDLGDMQIKLLQKIEELTLYMIEQDKENKEQRKQIEVQSEQIKHLQELVGNTK